MQTIKNEKWVLAILAAIQFTNIVDFMIMMPMGDILQKQLQISPSKYGLLVSSYGLAAFVTAFCGVFYLDRLDRRKALLYAYFGFMLGTMSSAILPTTSDPDLNYALFILTRVITGLTGGLLGGIVLSIIGDVIPLERRGRAMAIVTIAFSLASIIGVPIALTLVDMTDNNWHVPFYFVSALALPFWILSWKYIPQLNTHLTVSAAKKDRFETIRLAFTTREQRNALLFTILLVFGQFTVISMMTPFYINNIGLLQEDIKWIYLIGGLATVLSGFLIGRMVDKVGRFRVFTIFATLSIIPVVLITNLDHILPHIYGGNNPLPIVLAIGALFFIFISGRLIPANTITSTVVDPKHRGGFMSLNSACMSLASGASSLMAGLIVVQDHEHGPLRHYTIVGVVAATATVTSLLIVRLLKRIATQ